MLLLEALGATECVAATRRPVFAAIEAGTRLVDRSARAAAAALLARTFRGAEPDADLAAGDETPNETRSLTGGGVSKTRAVCLQPRAAAKLAAVAGIDLADLEAHDPHEKENKDAHPGRWNTRWYCIAARVWARRSARRRAEKKTNRKAKPRPASPRRCAWCGTSRWRRSRHPARWTPSARAGTARSPTASPRACRLASASGTSDAWLSAKRKRTRRSIERSDRPGSPPSSAPSGACAGWDPPRSRSRTGPEKRRFAPAVRAGQVGGGGAHRGGGPRLRAAMAGLRDPTRRLSPYSPYSSRNGNENENAARDVLPLDLPSGAVVFADDARSRAAR